MLVLNWMSKPAISVESGDSMADATKLLKEKNIRFLPVVERGKLVGVITDGDLKRASASDATSLDIHELFYLISKIKVKDIMTKDPFVVTPDLSIEETSKLFLKNKISGAPVVDSGKKIVGVITQSDLFRILTTLTGVDRSGMQLAFQVIDRPDSLKDITDIIRHYNGRIMSILTSYEKTPEGFRNVYIRAYQIDRTRLSELKKELHEKFTMLYMIDHARGEREIYSR
jgi:acetoin utilization protein AcuB